MAKVLLLEDDKNLSKGIKIALENDGHDVDDAHSFYEGQSTYEADKYDLFLLDINLPDGDGLAFCKRIRQEEKTPIVFITAKDTEGDMLEGFAAGCDDYISKPFSVEVLRKKVGAVIRLAGRERASREVFIYKDLKINFERMSVEVAGAECKLTATEYKLLEYLITNRGKVLTRGMILEHVFDADENFIDENTLSVYIRRIRQKICEDPKNPDYIVTVFGIGYTFGQ